MARKARISAESIVELRDFLSGADVDFGCRPVAVTRGDRFAATVVSSDEELGRLSRRRSGGVQIELLEEIPPPAARLRMVRPGNRFAGGQVPRGLGVKE
jgi:hypothetical protein